ncbi:MAG: acyl-CoA dehydrogenase [bacterium]|nr:acyl-CoA dehydrogenase [bacterium]
MDYKVDLRDVKFQLFEWLQTGKLLEAEKFADWDLENVEMVVDEALRLAQEQLAPVNEEGDKVGAQWNDGVVSLPESFKPVFSTITEGGWIGMHASPEFGGMGLPEAIGTAVNEFFNGANVSINLTLMLTRGAGAMIEHFGTDELKQLYVERIYSGEFCGTMCLTEAQAGSDVGASSTKAIKNDDGTYQITGEKIFITGGDHNLVDNIVHLVLARTPDAPEGTKGLSLFVVPKIWVNQDGSAGELNDVYCNNIEEKMGIHGSPTCTLVFGQNDGCRGYLLGDEMQGMKLMFHMMNAARIEVGLQGCAAAAAAHQQALAYAKERLQSRHWKQMKAKDAPQVAIVEHPDVRRMLLGAKAYAEAMRAILMQTSYFADMTHITEGDEQAKFASYLEVMTPICKAWCSEWGVQAARWCLHVYGGYGYTSEYPAEQYVRDAEIATIYEGTNGIQALDFVARKLNLRGGDAIRELLGMAEATFKRAKGDPELMEPAWMLAAGLKQIESIAKELPKRPDGIHLTLLNAVPVLDMVGTVLGAHMLLDQAMLAKEKLAAILKDKGVGTEDKKAYKEFLKDNDEAAFYHNKVQTAIHFAYRALPTVPAKAAAIRSGEKAPFYAIM